MKIEDIRSVYFVGAGGIGMSALVRYFLSLGKTVAGYDRVPSALTAKLNEEGALIHYSDDVSLIPEACCDSQATLVVYTPAVPAEHTELTWFRTHGFEIQKRAQVLGTITKSRRGLCVAGTHGKTTTSTMAAHLLHQSHVGTAAFLGGISQNYHTNLLLTEKSDYVVIEADEFDRSFHWLSPFIAVVTATDPDHLDIYGTPEAYWESFEKFISLIRPGGTLIIHEGLQIHPSIPEGVTVFTYSRTHGDFHAENIRIGNGEIFFDFVSPTGIVRDVQLGVPISINIDNGIAAMAVAQLCGVNPEELKEGMRTFRGVERRFDFKVKDNRHVFLSDYAHHPAEIRQSALSIRELYPERHITALFQPHLYTRTRDFYRDFAESLSLLDEVILVDIYPAREKPIPGVTSKLIYDNLAPGVEKQMISKEQIMPLLKEKKDELDVLISLGAGDIEDFVPQITTLLSE
ncbi:MAG: UDP-N-acetylmuramate--L-alanine ligase [Bacteroidaceae bacterium]|nr:UDP-N-acetylmuramate--L-alanine ligase [Bacteroidaceae bacterium]